MAEEKISFTTEDGEEVLFYILEQTRVCGVDYLLVTDSEEEEADCYILKDVSKAEDGEAVYEFVEDDETLASLKKIFAELTDITIQ